MNESEQPTPKSRGAQFVGVFLMLCALTALSFWISQSHLMDDRLTGWLAMMGVAFAKACLVIMFFMHLLWERHWKYALTIPAMIMGSLLVLLLVPDIGFRTKHYSLERKTFAAEQQSNTVKFDDSSSTNTNLK